MVRFDVVQIARDRLAELDRLQEAQDAERSKLREFLTMADQLQGAHHEMSVAVEQLARAEARSKPTPVSEIRKRAAAILEAVDRPMPLAELHNRLTRTGVVVGGKNPRSNLSAKLSGAEELQTIPGQGWVARKDKDPAAETARPYQNGTAG